jgi:hypothetical protein
VPLATISRIGPARAGARLDHRRAREEPHEQRVHAVTRVPSVIAVACHGRERGDRQASGGAMKTPAPIAPSMSTTTVARDDRPACRRPALRQREARRRATPRTPARVRVKRHRRAQRDRAQAAAPSSTGRPTAVELTPRSRDVVPVVKRGTGTAPDEWTLGWRRWQKGRVARAARLTVECAGAWLDWARQ